MSQIKPNSDRIAQLFNVPCQSDFRFVSRLADTAGQPELVLERIGAASLDEEKIIVEPSMLLRNEDGTVRFSMVQHPDCTILHCVGFADFVLRPDRIQCRLLDETRESMVRDILSRRDDVALA